MLLRGITAIFAAKYAVNMTWIHLDPNWPDFTWDSTALTVRLAQLRHRQGRLLGRMDALGFDLIQEANLQTLTADVVKSSAIENEILDPGEVRSSIARRLGMDVGGLIPVGRHVDGVVEMMLDATQNHAATLTADRLYDWHAALFPTGRSGMRRMTVGAWRDDSAGVMQVVSGAIGSERVHFEAPDTSRLNTEMSTFLAWFDGTQDIDPVIRSGIAHLWFVTIHPFEDGNGRIARAIADLALARADGIKERFYSMSSQIEAERKDYYAQLERQQRSSVDITGWLIWFLDCLDRSVTRSEATLAAVFFKAGFWERANQHALNNRQILILNRLLDGFKGYMTSSNTKMH